MLLTVQAEGCLEEAKVNGRLSEAAFVSSPPRAPVSHYRAPPCRGYPPHHAELDTVHDRAENHHGGGETTSTCMLASTAIRRNHEYETGPVTPRGNESAYSYKRTFNPVPVLNLCHVWIYILLLLLYGTGLVGLKTA